MSQVPAPVKGLPEKAPSPTGALHIGNYFGAIKQHIELQHSFPGEAFYFIADYHALTTTQDQKLLRQRTLDVALDYAGRRSETIRYVFFPRCR